MEISAKLGLAEGKNVATSYLSASRMKISEDELIEQIASACACGRRNAGLRLGMGDDAALFAPTPRTETVLTCDWFVEGNHFLRDRHPPESIGWKCLARALSDIAAMGARPKCFLLGLALPTNLPRGWLGKFLIGLQRASREYRCPLVGGDTTRKREISISITVIGEVRANEAIRRSGAKPGDVIFVSGCLGEAELGLRKMRSVGGQVARIEPSVRKHLYPEPRLEVGQWLAKNNLVSGMLDISDGLSSDLPRLCAASSVGARIEAAKLPVVLDKNGKTRAASQLLQLALNGGDDYELLFTVSPRASRRIPYSLKGIRLTCIGQITRGRRIILRSNGRDEHLAARGWDPFRRKS